MSRERINQLFAQAIELPAHQRADWIAEQCRGDEAMRAKVEQLLRADAKAHDFMEQAPASIADAAAAEVQHHPQFAGLVDAQLDKMVAAAERAELR